MGRLVDLAPRRLRRDSRRSPEGEAVDYAGGSPRIRRQGCGCLLPYRARRCLVPPFEQGGLSPACGRPRSENEDLLWSARCPTDTRWSSCSSATASRNLVSRGRHRGTRALQRSRMVVAFFPWRSVVPGRDRDHATRPSSSIAHANQLDVGGHRSAREHGRHGPRKRLPLSSAFGRRADIDSGACR